MVLGGTRAIAVAAFVAATVLSSFPARADEGEGNLSIELTKTVSTGTFAPSLALTFVVTPDRGIPADQLTYSATLKNAGGSIGLEGIFAARRMGGSGKGDAPSPTSGDTTVAAYFDLVEYLAAGDRAKNDKDGTWIPVAVASATLPGYTFVDPPPAAAPMSLTVISTPAPGVTYPTSGDAILGTRIAKGWTASWSYRAALALTPTQIAFLLDPTQVRAVRNHLEFEVTPRKRLDDPGKSQGDDSDRFTIDFTNQLRVRSGDLTNAVVTIAPPTGPSTDFTSATVPTLARLAPGASANVTMSYQIPVPAAKAAEESDAAYLARLTAASAPLIASAHATATANGTLVRSATPDPNATATELLPIVRITKQGPATADAGMTARYTIGLQNSGTALARDIAVDDLFPGGAHVATSGVPGTLDPGATPVTAQASFDIPLTQPVGDLADTASVTWRDANANAYGPVSARFTTTVTASGAGATLVLAPATAGPNVTGTSQTLTVTAKDKDGVAIAAIAVHLAVTGANRITSDATTNASGVASFTYQGTTKGDDTAQATATYRGTALASNTSAISWVTPIQPVTTTTVLARVFTSDGSGVFRTQSTETPQFSRVVPTINFNPPAGTVPHNTSGVGVFTRPFTNITTDLQGNFTGAIVLEGNGLQAGVGSLFNFNIVLTGEFTVAAAGDVTFNFFSDDGFVFGIGNGATRVSGPTVNAPPSGLTTFQGYTVVGSYNQPTAPVANTIVVHFPAAGAYPYEVDYTECCAGELALTMTQGTARTGVPPSGSLALTPITIAPKPVGQTQRFTVATMDASGDVITNLPVVLSITGANTQQISGITDDTGIATFTYQGGNAGNDHAQAGASLSGMPAISNLVSLDWSPVPAPKPVIGAVMPADDATVTTPVAITASFTPPAGQTIASWSVRYRRVGTTTDVTLASGTGSPPATLATFDPTRLPNGVYAVTVSATASGGGVETATTNLAVDGALKLGHYVRTFRDLAVPVAGLPMEVLRTYDSNDKSVGDFGVGWHVDLANFHVATARPLGLGGWTQYNAQCFFGLCLTAFRSSIAHDVTVTWPDGHQEIFDFTPDGGTNIFWTGSAKFTGRPGTSSTLDALGATGLDYVADGNLYSGAVYDPQRFRLTASDGTAYVLDRSSGLVSLTDTNGNTLTVSAGGVTSSLGPSIAFTRDGLGRITTITGPSGQTLRYAYSTAGDLATFTDANGNATSFTYDAAHDLVGMSGPAGPLRTVAYDANGRITSVTDGAGNTTTVSNDVSARQQVITDATGQLTTVLTYSETGDLVREDATFSGRTLTTAYAYDADGRLIRQTDPLGHPVSFTYDGAGNMTSIVDAAGRTTRLTYDAKNRPTSQIAPDGVTTAVLTYDARGNLVQQQRADGSSYGYAYDSAGRVTSLTDPTGRIVRLGYGSNGQLASVTDNGGHVVTYTTDDTGRTLSIGGATGTTTFAYDGAGNLTHIGAANGHGWTFVYDYLGHLTSSTDPAGRSTTYVYDVIGRLMQRTERNGDVTSFAYDPAGRLTSETAPGPRVTTVTYDPLGRPTALANEDARIAYTYDDASRVVSETTSGTASSPQPTVALGLTYDASGVPLSVRGPEGTTSYAYDAATRITGITDASGGAFHFAYDGIGRLVGVARPNGVSDALAYDAANQLLSRVSARGAVQLASAAYTYDASGHRTALTDSSGTHVLTYDTDGRLITATHPAATGIPNETYTYDTIGNRTSSADSAANAYDTADRLVSDATFTYVWDAKGRLASRTDRASGAVTTYTWGADDLLLAVNHPDGTSSRYRYDPLGRRIEVNDGGQITRYAYDGMNVRLEYDGTNALVASYTTGFAPGSVFEMRRGTTAYYELQDGVGSTTALADSSGAVAASYAYDSFGRTASTGGLANAYTFTGQQRDARTGLYYFRARYYDPRSGRFISQDPIQSINPYIYANNAPLDFVDPTGAQAFVERAEIDAQRVETEVALRELASQLCGQIVGAILGAGLGPNVMGPMAEDYVGTRFLGGLGKNTTLLDPSGVRRIPDFIQRGFIEVKNVGRLAYTQQIKDLVALLPKGEQLTLYVRGGTKLSGPLLDAIRRSGLIKVLRCLPG